MVSHITNILFDSIIIDRIGIYGVLAHSSAKGITTRNLAIEDERDGFPLLWRSF